MDKNCNNCNTALAGKFCSNCGQPAELKRIDAHYIKHEIEHVLHFEKGILYTIKELFIRPGKSVREFLTDNRNRLVKPIIFIIITSLLYSILTHYFHIEEQYLQQNGFEKSAIGKIMTWIQGHYGYANILMGIFIAFFIKLFFKKYDFNLYEIIILLCFTIGIGMLIFALFSILEGIFHVKMMPVAGILAILYITFAIANFFDKKDVRSYLKALAAYILGCISFYIVVIIIGLAIDLLLKK
ncbi:DUF3667 domain-containing protein [Pedobacter sp. MW01-1-1]|uniref:DUF3667 domain-containing protein n=1 Tax=Pedobacter sp. MW01-1-1 TaxID=3383027 RepID=UPI003FF04430